VSPLLTTPERFENVTGECCDYANVTVFDKLRVRDRLVWTVGLTVEIKLRFPFADLCTDDAYTKPVPAIVDKSLEAPQIPSHR